MTDVIYTYQITNYALTSKQINISGQILTFLPNTTQTIQSTNKLTTLDTFFQLVQINIDKSTTVLQYANSQYTSPTLATEGSVQILIGLIRQLLAVSNQELAQETLTAVQTAATASELLANAASNVAAGTNITISDGNNVTQGSKSDASWDGTSPSTQIGLLKYCGLKLAAAATSAAQIAQTTVLNTISSTLNTVSNYLSSILNVSAPFTPMPLTTIAITVGTSATTPIQLPALQNASSYRIRSSLNSVGDVAWRFTVGSTNSPVLPVPFSTTGTGGSIGDKCITPGGVEIMGLDSAKQAALAAGNLYLAGIATNGASNVLFFTFGNGS